MNTVIVHPERCVGCMQCSAHCAVAHSQGKTLFAAVFEQPRPAPRIHVGPGPNGFAFPNKCRHCDPAPCQGACMPRAITRDAATGAVLVDPSRCIHCGMCSMVCPFGVIRYREDRRSGNGHPVAVKCDNCVERQKAGEPPACVEACAAGALEFGDPNELLRDQSRELSRRWSLGVQEGPAPAAAPEAVQLWRALAAAE
jgi:carbon-monoxide dehydrogenase iron sulfur subunit